MESFSLLLQLLPILLTVVLGIFGYRLLKIKGHSPGTYLLILISSTPLFWIIFGLTKSKKPTSETKKWSNFSLLWGVISFALIIFSKEILTENVHALARPKDDISWTPEKVQQFKELCKNSLSATSLELNNTDSVINCMVEKTMEKFPEGLDFSKSNPKIDSTLQTVGIECGEIWLDKEIFSVKWTENSENYLLNSLKKEMANTTLNSEQMDNIANCVLMKIKKRFPNGLDSSEQTQTVLEKETLVSMEFCISNEINK